MKFVSTSERELKERRDDAMAEEALTAEEDELAEVDAEAAWLCVDSCASSFCSHGWL
jgi:hypothetical protein